MDQAQLQSRRSGSTVRANTRRRSISPSSNRMNSGMLLEMRGSRRVGMRHAHWNWRLTMKQTVSRTFVALSGDMVFQGTFVHEHFFDFTGVLLKVDKRQEG